MEFSGAALRARTRRSLSVIAGAAVAAAASRALAGNDEGIPLGDEAALTSNSVAATVADGSSLFYNPAGLAGAERDQVDVSATATALRFYRVPDLLRTTSGGRASGSFTEFVSVPSAVSYVRGAGRDFTLGVGVFVPESFSWTIDATLRRDGSTFHLSTTSREALYYGIFGVGYRASPELRLGASLAGLYLSGVTTAAAWAGGDGSASATRLFGVSQLYSVSALGTTLAIGAQWEPRPGFRVGAALRAPTFTVMSAVRGTQVQGDASSGGVPVVGSLAVNETTTGLHQARALRLRLGMAKTWDTSFLAIEADFQPGVRDRAIAVDRKPVSNLRAGGMVAVSNVTWIGAGVSTDRSAEKEANSVLESRLDFYGVSAGVRLDHPHRLAAGEPAANVVFSTTFGLRYAYGTGAMGGIVFESMPNVMNVGGDNTVRAAVHELALYLGSTVYF